MTTKVRSSLSTPSLLAWKLARTAALQDILKIGIALTATAQVDSGNKNSVLNQQHFRGIPNIRSDLCVLA